MPSKHNQLKDIQKKILKMIQIWGPFFLDSHLKTERRKQILKKTSNKHHV